MSTHNALLLIWQDYPIYSHKNTVNNYTTWLLTLSVVWYICTMMKHQSKVKIDSMPCAKGEITKQPQRLFKNKIQTCFHSSEADFFQVKANFLPLSITISAIWDKSCVTYIWRDLPEIFLRVCRRLFEAAQMMKKSKCQYGVQSKLWSSPAAGERLTHTQQKKTNNQCRPRPVCLLLPLLFCKGLVSLPMQPKAKDVLCCDWWNLNQTRPCK